jgi:hypothetical protein
MCDAEHGAYRPAEGGGGGTDVGGVYEGAMLPTQGTGSTAPWPVITLTLVGDERGPTGGPPLAGPCRTAQPLASAATHPAATAITAIRRIRHLPQSVAPVAT